MAALAVPLAIENAISIVLRGPRDQTIFYRLFFEIFRYVEIIRIYLFIILHEFSTTSLDTQTLINNLK